MNSIQKQRNGLEKAIKEGRVDNKILPLVEVLWAYGIPTKSSCQGHLEGNKDPYPSVTIGIWKNSIPDKKCLFDLMFLLGQWNVYPEGEENRGAWILCPYVIPGEQKSEGFTWFYDLQPEELNPQRDPFILRYLQDEARRIAEFFLSRP